MRLDPETEQIIILQAPIELFNDENPSITTVRALCEKGIIDLTLRKTKAVQKKMVPINKRKRDNGEAIDLVEMNARVGTRNEHFLQLINGEMDTLDAHRDEALWRKLYG